jgi:hypothetical protein
MLTAVYKYGEMPVLHLLLLLVLVQSPQIGSTIEIWNTTVNKVEQEDEHTYVTIFTKRFSLHDCNITVNGKPATKNDINKGYLINYVKLKFIKQPRINEWKITELKLESK